MKVYLKYLDKLDPNYKLVALDETKNSKLHSKEDIVNLLEANKFEVFETQTIRFYNQEYRGWQILNDDSEIIPKKIMIELNRSYKTNKFIPKTEEMLVKIETYMAQMRILILKSLINRNSNAKKGIVILTSSPLKYGAVIGEGNDTSMVNYYNPVNYEASLSNIIDTTKPYNLEYKYTILTKETLQDISSYSFISAIVHIYCYSGYDENGNFFLSFEDKRGNLIKGTVDDFKQLNDSLKKKRNNKDDETLFIIITPHNEDAGDMLSMAGIKNFLCVHSNLINDYQERKFTKLLYESLLLKENVQNVEESVSLFMETEYKSNPLFQCCCFHSHSENCQWKRKAISNHYNCHIDHMAYSCKCKSKQFNLHKKVGCNWAKQFISNYSPLQIKNSKNKKICCCSIELPHDKVIQLKYSFDNKTLTPFNDVVKDNSKDSRMTNSCLDLPFSLSLITSLIGRNAVVYDIVNFFIKCNANDSNENSKCVVLNGQKNVGKKELAKYCGIYLYERGYVTGVLMLNEEKCNSDTAIINEISKNEANELNKQVNILLIIIITSNHSKIHQYLSVVLPEYPNIKCLLVNESESNITLGKQINVEPLQLTDISNLINELDPNINSLDTSPTIIQGGHSEYENLLLETEGKFYKIFLLNKAFNDKKGSILISELRKVIRENTEAIDVSNIKSDPRKLELIYLLQFSESGFSFNDLDFFLYPVPIELLFDMFPIVIKRTREEEDFFQIQSSFFSFITKTIKIPQAIKAKVKLMLLIKFSMIYRYLINKNCAHLTDFGAQLNYGMWNSLKPFSDIDQMCLARLNDKRKLMFVLTLFKRVFIKETFKQLFDNKDIGQEELKQHIEDISISIPTLFYFKENIHSLNLIKYFSRLLDNFDNFEFAKGRLYLLFAFFHANVGISTYENYILEEEQVKKAMWYFNIISHYEGLGECYFFSSINKFNCRSFIHPTTDYICDINTAIKYYSKHSTNSLGFARAAYQTGFYDLDNQIIVKSNLDNLYKAFDIFTKDNNAYALNWQLHTLLLISKIALLLENYTEAKASFDKGNSLLLLRKCNENDIKQLYTEYEEQMTLLLNNNRRIAIGLFEFTKDTTKSQPNHIKYSYRNMLMNSFIGINNTETTFELKYEHLSECRLNKIIKDCHYDVLFLLSNSSNHNNALLNSLNNVSDQSKGVVEDKKRINFLKCKLLFLIIPFNVHFNVIKHFIQLNINNIIVIISKKPHLNNNDAFIINQCIISDFFCFFFSELTNNMGVKKSFDHSIERLIMNHDINAKYLRLIHYSNDSIVSPSIMVNANNSAVKDNNTKSEMRINDQTNIPPLIDFLLLKEHDKEDMIYHRRIIALLSLNQQVIECNDILMSINTDEVDYDEAIETITKFIIIERNEIDLIIRINFAQCNAISDIIDLYTKKLINIINDTKNNSIGLNIIIIASNMPIGLISTGLFHYLFIQKAQKCSKVSIVSNIIITILTHNNNNENILSLFKEYIGDF